MKIREYSGPLTVVMMGILGFSLFCIVSAVALAGANEAHPVSIEPQNIVDSAFSNFNTMAALTVEVITQYVSTSTPTPTDTLTFSPTSNLLSTATHFISLPSRLSTRTHRPDPTLGPSPTSTHIPSSTPSRIPSATPSNTPVPTSTSTAIPTETDTPVPTATNTPEPTNTPVPPTSTPVPPTNTPVPPTNTPVPPTDTPNPPSTTPAGNTTGMPASDSGV